MEDWTKRKETNRTLNVWEQGLRISGIKEQEERQNIIKAQLQICLIEYEKDIRRQVCEEIWKEFETRLMNKTEDMPVMKVANMINSVLDKVKGETKC